METLNLTKFPALDYTRREEFNTLNINLGLCGTDLKVIGVISAGENEGKSFTSMYLARTLAEDGKKVLLIDTDLRKSRLVRDYGIKCEHSIYSLVHYLAGRVGMDEIIYETNFPGLHMILSETTAPNPVNLLQRPFFGDLVQAAKETYDFVIIDSPPINLVIDGAIISQQCEGILLVVNHGHTRRGELQDAVKQLEMTGTQVIGAVFNQVPMEDGTLYYRSKKYRKYNSYGYGYGQYGKSSASGKSSGKDAGEA